MQEVRHVFSSSVEQVIRLFNDPYGATEEVENFLEFFHKVALDERREMITRFSTDLATNNTFFNDDK